MKVQFGMEKTYQALAEDSNKVVKTKSLVKNFEVYNDISYYKTGNDGAAGGSTRCCSTGTCDIDH